MPATSQGEYRRIAFFEIGDAVYRYDPPIHTDFFVDVADRLIKLM